MSEFISPTNLTYVFLEARGYNESEMNRMKETWLDLSKKHGAEAKNPDAIVNTKVSHELVFEGVQVVETKAINGLVAAFKDSKDAQNFSRDVHHNFVDVNQRGKTPVTEFKTSDLSFVTNGGPARH